MRKTLIGILLLFLLIGGTSIVSAGIDNLSTEVGSTYIKWSWDYNTSTDCAVWIDGKFETETSLSSFTLTNLIPLPNLAFLPLI